VGRALLRRPMQLDRSLHVGQRVRLQQNGAAPVRDPVLSIKTPLHGARCNDPPGGALAYSSASLAACLNIFTNISRVSLPVCVFWFDGW
jgi:hypothetical protein